MRRVWIPVRFEGHWVQKVAWAAGLGMSVRSGTGVHGSGQFIIMSFWDLKGRYRKLKPRS